jgi:hypothetical protein
VDFSDALRAAKDGKRVRRALWAELGGRVGTWVELVQPGPCSNGMQLGELLVCPLPGSGKAVLFELSQWDVLEKDWELVPPDEAA